MIGCINALPATTTKKITDKSEREIIEENITKGSWNFISNSAIHQQGFPALDYLLFSEGAIDKFSAPNAASRKKYVNDVLARIKLLLDQTTSTWKNSYRAEFISNTKSNSGSPISYLLNQFSYEMDMIKGPRIGWPYGTMSGGTQFPEWVEGYYAGISLDLAIENMKSLKTMFNGGGSGKGISDLLNALGHTKLTNDILTQFESVDKKLKAIPAPLSKSLSTNKKQIDEALAEIQLLLKLIKTEATSKLGVQISYVDNDGD